MQVIYRPNKHNKQLPLGPSVLLLCIAIVITILGSSVAAEAGMPVDSDAIIRCEPIINEGRVGETLAIDIYIEDVTDLYAADVRPTFDTTIAQAEDADGYPDNGIQMEPLGTFLSPDFIIKNEVDNSAGTTWYATTQLNPTPAVSGSGSIVRLYLKGITTGTFNITFDYVKIVRRDGSEIPSTWEACTVTFADQQNTVTPTVTPTNTVTPTLTNTPTLTVTPTQTSTPSPTPVIPEGIFLPLVLHHIFTPTPTPSASPTPTHTATPTPQPHPTHTPTPPLPPSPTPRPTDVVPPTSTHTPWPTATATPSQPIATATATPSGALPPGSRAIANIEDINDIAVDPQTGRVYLTSRGPGKLYVLNKNNDIIAQTEVCDLPFGIALDSVTRRGYIACFASGMLTVFDMDSYQVLTRISVGPEPTYPAVFTAKNRIYVPTHGNGQLVEVNGSDGSVLRRTYAGEGVFGMVIDESLNRAYITARDMKTINTIDLSAMREMSGQRMTPGGIPFALGFNPVTHHLYVHSLLPGDVDGLGVFRTSQDGLTHLTTSPISEGGNQMGGRVGVNPNTNHIFIINTAAQSMTVIDGNSNRTLTEIPLWMNVFGVAVNQQSSTVYVGGREQDILWVIPDQF